MDISIQDKTFIPSYQDIKAEQAFYISYSKNINITDIFHPCITTKIAGKEFKQKLEIKNPKCIINKIEIIDENNNSIECNIIKNKFLKVTIPKNYKNLRYKIYYTLNGKEKIDYSTDNFSVKPYDIKYIFNKPEIKGSVGRIKIYFFDYNGKVIDFYQKVTLITNKKMGYILDSDKYVKGQIIPYNSGKYRCILDYSKYTSIDKDDTPEFIRYIGLKLSFNVNPKSKSWAGAGTNESENAPAKNNINSDIRQNTKKDVHFQKMGW